MHTHLSPGLVYGQLQESACNREHCFSRAVETRKPMAAGRADAHTRLPNVTVSDDGGVLGGGGGGGGGKRPAEYPELEHYNQPQQPAIGTLTADEVACIRSAVEMGACATDALQPYLVGMRRIYEDTVTRTVGPPIARRPARWFADGPIVHPDGRRITYERRTVRFAVRLDAETMRYAESGLHDEMPQHTDTVVRDQLGWGEMMPGARGDVPVIVAATWGLRISNMAANGDIIADNQLFVHVPVTLYEPPPPPAVPSITHT